MRALYHQGKDLAGLKFGQLEAPAPRSGEVMVKLKSAALNHRDIWTCYRHQTSETPVILGSDGAGQVAALGRSVRRFQLGDEVIINPSLNWQRGEGAPGPDFQILGHPRNGTFAEFITIPATNLELKPKHLGWAEAAALPLSALTGFRALTTKGRLKPGDSVVIPGIGGGTALFTCQLALAMGARVFVTSSQAEKRKRALQLGVAAAFDSGSEWARQLIDANRGRGADIVIESVGQPTWAQSLKALGRGGRLVVYGSTGGDRVESDLVPLFLGWQSILGTTMGNRQEFQAMVKFVTKKKIVPIIDRIFKLEDGVAAMHYLNDAKQFGKVVLDIA